jgi:hypothetical protein
LYLFFTWFVHAHNGPTHQIVELTEEETRCLVALPRAGMFEFEPGTAQPIDLEQDVVAAIEVARQRGVAPRLRVIVDPFEVSTPKRGLRLAEERASVLQAAFVAQGARPPEVETVVELGPRRLMSLGEGARLGRIEAWPEGSERPPGLVWLTGPGLSREALEGWQARARAEGPGTIAAGLHVPEASLRLGQGRRQETLSLDPTGALVQELLAGIEGGCRF